MQRIAALLVVGGMLTAACVDADPVSTADSSVSSSLPSSSTAAPATASSTTSTSRPTTATSAPADTSSTTVAGDPTDIDFEPLVAFVENKVGRTFDRPPELEVVGADRRAAIAPDGSVFVSDELWALFLTLGLVGPDDDQVAAGQARVDRIRGFCCPVTIFHTGDPIFTEVVAVHELTHLIDEQNFPGGTLAADEVVDPLGAVYEGNAHRVAFDYAAELEQRLGVELEDPPAIFPPEGDPRLPDAMQQVLEFPYDEGRVFSATLAERGGQELVDQSFERGPATTEQVLDIEAYLADERPVPVEQPNRPDGATSVGVGSIGSFVISLLAAPQLGDEPAVELATAWAGDAYDLYRLDGELCLAATVEMDDEVRAAALLDVFLQAGMAKVGGTGTKVEVVNCVAEPG